jgi:hypothetical protein
VNAKAALLVSRYPELVMFATALNHEVIANQQAEIRRLEHELTSERRRMRRVLRRARRGER